MKLNCFEKDILKAIGKHYPVILEVLDLLEVKSRENTGSGMYINFKPLEKRLESHVQILDLHGTIKLPEKELGAHIEMQNGMPEFLEICCFSSGGWDGDSRCYSIDN